MPIKTHISALVYVAIVFVILFGVQQLERSCSAKKLGMRKINMQSPSYEVQITDKWDVIKPRMETEIKQNEIVHDS